MVNLSFSLRVVAVAAAAVAAVVVEGGRVSYLGHAPVGGLHRLEGLGEPLLRVQQVPHEQLGDAEHLLQTGRDRRRRRRRRSRKLLPKPISSFS